MLNSDNKGRGEARGEEGKGREGVKAKTTKSVVSVWTFILKSLSHK